MKLYSIRPSMASLLQGLLALFLLAQASAQAAELHFTAKQQRWLQQHLTVRLGIDPSYAPYSFIDEEGRPRGVVIDLLPLIEERLGIRFEIVSGLNWPGLMQALRDRRLDAVATVVRLPERESFIAFSRIYLPTPLVVMTRDDAPALQDLDELRQLRVVLVEGYSSSKQLLERYPELKPRFVTTPAEGLRAVASGEADAYVGALGVSTYLATRHGLSNLKVNAAFDMANNGQRFGIRKDWPVLAELLDKALAAIPGTQKEAILARWLPPQIGELAHLGHPRYVVRLFPWLLGILGLALLGYVVAWMWNRQLQRQLALRSASLQQALTAAEQRKEILESVFQALPDLFFLMHSDGTVLEYRARREGELYVPPEAFLGRRMQDVLPPALAEQFQGALDRLRDRDRLIQYEYDLPLADGEHRFEARLSRLADGEHVIAVVRDITEAHLANQQLQESKARHQQTLESMTDGFVALDRDWCYLYVNQRAAKMLGREPASLIGRNIWEEFPEGVGQPFHQAYQKVMETGEPRVIEEYYAPWDRWFENRIYPTEYGISIFFQDITLRRQAEAVLRRSRDELEQRVRERTRELEAANKELETFTYSVSHDLKAPLRGIDGYSHLLLEDHSGSLNEEGRQFLRNIRRGVAQMNQLIDDLLAYSRMERQDLHSRPVDLAALVQEILAERQAGLDDKGVQLELDVPPVTVQADRNGLALVLRNLFDNAVKFSASRQPPLIGIRGEVREKSVTLIITDNGIGFDMAFHERIFALFQRLQRNEDYPGTGIGLAIVARAMQRMGGRVWAESTPGEGASFYLELPR